MYPTKKKRKKKREKSTTQIKTKQNKKRQTKKSNKKINASRGVRDFDVFIILRRNIENTTTTVL